MTDFQDDCPGHELDADWSEVSAENCTEWEPEKG